MNFEEITKQMDFPKEITMYHLGYVDEKGYQKEIRISAESKEELKKKWNAHILSTGCQSDSLVYIVNAGEDSKKKQALKHMEILCLDKGVRDRFKEKDEIMVSLNGYVFPLDVVKNAKKAVKYVRERELYPYHVVVGELEGIGTVYDVFYISRYEEDWDYDIPRKEKDGTYVATIFSVGKYCEIGTIGIQSQYGSLKRVF